LPECSQRRLNEEALSEIPFHRLLTAFFTGLCVLNSRTGEAEVCGVPTLVGFRELTDLEIESYLRREPAYNCAGSAKSEGLGISLLSRIHGDDPNALIGLPLIALCDLLRKHGMNVL